MRDVVPSNIPVWRWYQIKRGIIIFFKAPKKVVKHLKYEPCPIRLGTSRKELAKSLQAKLFF